MKFAPVTVNSQVSPTSAVGATEYIPYSSMVMTRITSYNVCYTKLLRDISAEFEDLPSGAVAGDEVTVSIIVRSTFPSKVTPNYSLEVINKNEGRTLTMEKDNLQFGGAITSATGSLEIEKKNRITSYNVCYTKLLRLWAG